MVLLGIAVNSDEVYLVQYSKETKRMISSEKFLVANENGNSLKELYKFMELYIKGIPALDAIILEVAMPGLRSPSFVRIKAEGIIDLLITDLGLCDVLHKIRTQKTKKRYPEIIGTTKWEELHQIKYSSKMSQVTAYVLLEGLL